VIVVDASALLELLLKSPAAAAVAQHLFAPRQTLHAPHLLDVEVAHGIRRLTILQHLGADRALLAISDLAAFPLRRYPHDVLLSRIWQLKDNFTAYDAAYVALAEALDASLLTRDQKLASSAQRHVHVELV
jgi:predicted nucleic acid-binding protein